MTTLMGGGRSPRCDIARPRGAPDAGRSPGLPGNGNPCYLEPYPSQEGTVSFARKSDGSDQGIAGVRAIVEVQVRDNNVDQALRALKKKMQREGLYREMRMRRHYEKPSERRAREKAEALRRYRKLMRKRAERDEV